MVDNYRGELSATPIRINGINSCSASVFIRILNALAYSSLAIFCCKTKYLLGQLVIDVTIVVMLVKFVIPIGSSIIIVVLYLMIVFVCEV